MNSSFVWSFVALFVLVFANIKVADLYAQWFLRLLNNEENRVSKIEARSFR